ncbi:uncharacterized protein LOC120305702 [Crotalus tigris]|uniref:uncharacterized protein LOC120305702 n=1 Tax=Crotalus tigris TaxID=88082 RepID=UPI00192F8911|nr:uncharacterized protein LOC120305702 [Crotalus tigris]
MVNCTSICDDSPPRRSCTHIPVKRSQIATPDCPSDFQLQPATSTPPSTEEPQRGSKGHPELIARINCLVAYGASIPPPSFSPTCLAKVYPAGRPEEAVKVYVSVAPLSTHSIARSAVFDLFDVPSEEMPYTLLTYTGSLRTVGRVIAGLCIESLDGSSRFPLPPLLEWDNIPIDHSQIGTRETARAIPHLRHMADLFPPLDPEAEILLLLGQDAPLLLGCERRIRGPPDTPVALKTELGWVLVGTVSVPSAASSDQANVPATSILRNGRASPLKPCQRTLYAFEH